MFPTNMYWMSSIFIQSYSVKFLVHGISVGKSNDLLPMRKSVSNKIEPFSAGASLVAFLYQSCFSHAGFLGMLIDLR